jgi:site-specific DNA recombinase
MRVAIYARYSSENQRDASIDDQFRLCRERADQENWNVVNCYSDHAISGSSLLRSGIQALLEAAMAGEFDVILAEALDRISRDQADIANVYKRLKFADARIITLSEGVVSDLHIGLKGTMNALFLKDLADKTRRGLRGRVEAGKSGGGNSFGYDVVQTVQKDGTIVRGDRVINPVQASVVKRICEEYASGKSPRAIAKELNLESIPGPRGNTWGPSVIHGHRKRGTGILNNELYVGKLVWNRLRYIKDPDTGKRVSRLNPEAEWIIKDVPEMRIVTDELWQFVKQQQGEMGCHTASDPAICTRRRPKHLFSGLLRCGVCGGGFIGVNKDRLGCSTAKNKGTCSNRQTMLRDDLEQMVLKALQEHLMTPELCDVFCKTYTQHLNELRRTHDSERAGRQAELKKIDRQQDQLVKAIMEGVPGSKVKDEMTRLEDRKSVLEAQLTGTGDELVRLHPNMSEFYRERILGLQHALTHENQRHGAAGVVRRLIEQITLSPIEIDGEITLAVDLQGHLAGILALASKSKDLKTERNRIEKSLKLVAGVGFEPTTFRL